MSLSENERFLAQFELNVSYSQVALFTAGLVNPFNDWTESHVHQGFSWRPESVSFATLNESGRVTFKVQGVNDFEIMRDAVRAIQVPFNVSESNLVEIASIADSRVIEVPSGSYTVFFETGYDENRQMWCRLSFKMDNRPIAKILRTDAELTPPKDLVLSAVPAK